LNEFSVIKIRVYEVAREMGLDNRRMVTIAASMGIPVRNHMSALEPEHVELRVLSASVREDA